MIMSTTIGRLEDKPAPRAPVVVTTYSAAEEAARATTSSQKTQLPARRAETQPTAPPEAGMW
jgi:hypothetical protein